VCEAVDIETCIQRIEAAPHDDDVRGRQREQRCADSTIADLRQGPEG
jgi:hypothetical protein